MVYVERPKAAFILSLLAGILILANGILAGLAVSFVASVGGASLSSAEMFGLAKSALTMLQVLTVIVSFFGVIILLGALTLYYNPAHRKGWGIAIIILSLLSILVGGGFLVGLILGVIGGALAIAWKPPSMVKQAQT